MGDTDSIHSRPDPFSLFALEGAGHETSCSAVLVLHCYPHGGSIAMDTYTHVTETSDDRWCYFSKVFQFVYAVPKARGVTLWLVSTLTL